MNNLKKKIEKIFSVNDYFFLSGELKKIYPIIVDYYSDKFSTEFKISKAFYEYALNASLQSITYLFFYKLKKFQNVISIKDLSINQFNYDLTPNTPYDHDKNLTDISYNIKLDKLFSIENDYHDYPDRNNPKEKIFNNDIFRNYLFETSKLERLVLRANKILFFILYPFFKKKNIILSMANSDNSFRKYLFYIGSNINIISRRKYLNSKINIEKRNRIFDNSDFLQFDVFKNILKSFEINESDFLIIEKKLIKFYKYLIPIQLLEKSQDNYFLVKKNIIKFNPSFILSGSGTNFDDDLINACAYEANIKIIRAQHGAFYGYLQHMRWSHHEIPLSNEFITWGWSNLKDTYSFEHVNFVPLPSPWLSERKTMWKNYNINFSNNYFDILYMPQCVKYFDVMPINCSFVNRDILPNFKFFFFDLMISLNKNNIKTLVKYYNIESFNALSSVHEILKNKFNETYFVHNNFDKGLSKTLLSKAKIVIWDQPGTGFLECISSNIPTMVFWDRSYSKEFKECEQYFNELEKIGLLSNNIESLVKEISLYLNSPTKWINTKYNTNTIFEFKKMFCDTDKFWWKKWRNYLKQIND